MHDDFDPVLAHRFEVLDDVPVPDTWMRVQSKALNHMPVHLNEEHTNMIDLETPHQSDEQRKGSKRLVVAALLAAAAVVAIALAAIRQDEPVSPADQPSPTVTVPPTAPPPALFGATDDPLAAGTYSLDQVEGSPTPRIVVTIGDGWGTFDDWGLTRDDGQAMTFSVPDRIFLDACHPGDGDHPGPLNTLDGLVTALQEQGGWIDVTIPSDISIDGYAGKAFQRATPADLSSCPGDFTSWTETVYAPGSTNNVWVLDLDGTVIILETRVHTGQPPETHAELPRCSTRSASSRHERCAWSPSTRSCDRPRTSLGGAVARSAAELFVGVDPAETDPVSVERGAFGVFVRSARCRRWTGGLCRSAVGVERASVLIGEHHAVGLVGIARDAELVAVMQPVVARAQAQQVPGVGRATVLPVPDVVDLDDLGEFRQQSGCSFEGRTPTSLHARPARS